MPVPHASAIRSSGGVVRVVFGANHQTASERRPLRRGLVTYVEQGGQLRPAGSAEAVGAADEVNRVHWLGDVAVTEGRYETSRAGAFAAASPTLPQFLGDSTLENHIGLLYPVGGGQVLGVGPAPDQNRLPARVSAFDFALPAAPVLTGSADVGGISSYAAYFPEAFAWVPGRRLAVLPAHAYVRDGACCSRQVDTIGVVRVDPDGRATTVGTLEIPSAGPIVAVGRNVVLVAGGFTLLDPGRVRVVDRLGG